MRLMKKVLIPLSIVLSLGVSSSQALASTYPSNPNSDNNDWDHPYTGYMEGYKYSTGGKNWIHAQIYGKYNSSQITNMKNTSYYPTLEIKDDTQLGFIVEGRSYTSNYPDPKFDVDYCGSHIQSPCELEVANKNNSLMVAEREYYLSTEWEKPSPNDVYLIAYSSQSREPTWAECAAGQCELNTVSGTASALSGFYVNSASGTWNSISNNTLNLGGTQAKKEKKKIYDENGDEKHKVAQKEYAAISNIDQLKIFAEKANIKAKDIDSAQEYDFTLTFNDPVNEKVLSKYKNTISKALIYARGVSHTNERITIGLIGFDDSTIERIQKSNDYVFEGFTQITGRAKGSIIKNILNEKEIFSVEVASESTIPMGLYWKLEDLK